MPQTEETTPVSLTYEEIDLIIGTFEDQEFDRGDEDDEDTDEDSEPAEGSEQAIANSLIEKMETAKKLLGIDAPGPVKAGPREPA